MLSQCLIGKVRIPFKKIIEKGYIDKSDLGEVFSILGESVGDDEINSKEEI